MIIETNDLNLPELLPYSERSEKQLVHLYEPNLGVFIAESPNVIKRAIAAGYQPESFLVAREQLKDETTEILSQYPDIPCYTVYEKKLKEITGYQMCRGVLALFRRQNLVDAETLISNAKRICVLEDVMNPTNVGAIFRSAAALSVDCILLSPACSDPLYRRSARVSMGTVFQIPWSYVDDDYLPMLKKAGFTTVATALCDDSLDIRDVKSCNYPKMAIIMGTEGTGLRESTIANTDIHVKIPMSHAVDSLNVAAASAVVFYALCL